MRGCARAARADTVRRALHTRARALHKQSPLIDGHNDYPWALRGLDPGRDLNKADISKPVPALMTDIPRLRQGGIGAQFWSVYVPSTMLGKEAVRATLERIIEKFPGLAAAELARQRLEHLRLEFKGKEQAQVVHLGTYEKDLGLKRKPPG